MCIISDVLRDFVKSPRGRPWVLASSGVSNVEDGVPVWREAPMAGNTFLLFQEKNIFPAQVRTAAEEEATITAMIFTKSFSPRVSKMVVMVCLAMAILSPFILPLMSTRITMSLGEVAACMYL